MYVDIIFSSYSVRMRGIFSHGARYVDMTSVYNVDLCFDLMIGGLHFKNLQEEIFFHIRS